MRGKKKCRLLREIRQRIAQENDIPLVTEECEYKGDCRGTCPKCESELRYLEEQLAKRRALGLKVTVSAMAVGLAVGGLTGCRPTVAGYIEEYTTQTETETPTDGGELTEMGDVPYIPDETEDGTEDGTEEEPFMLEGDVLYTPEESGGDNG